MYDFDSIQLAKCLDIAPVIPVENDLVESQNVAAIFNVVHLDLDTRAASARRGRIDVADHCARVEIERVRLEELHECHRLPNGPEDLR